MISRVYFNELLSFKDVELLFDKDNRLIVFSGPSGAGKSVLMEAILAVFGFKEINAKISEVCLDNELELIKEGILIDDDVVIRVLKHQKTRYFINNQSVSKKFIKEHLSKIVNYLSVRKIDEFSNDNLIELIDNLIDDTKFKEIINIYKTKFDKLNRLKTELNNILQTEKAYQEKKEFLEYEIEKISSINPKLGEFEELLEIKKLLSKIDKLKSLRVQVEGIFEYERVVEEFLELVEFDKNSFEFCMNELRIAIESVNDKINELNDIDVEEILNRLSKLQYLINRFGSIEESLEYLEEKKREYEKLTNIEFEKSHLQKEIEILNVEIEKLANEISEYRKKFLPKLQDRLNYYLSKLYLNNLSLVLKRGKLTKHGFDIIEWYIDDVDINSISTGELNRLRVAFLASKIEFEKSEKILFLDEIDANLSGEESMSVSEVLKLLSKKYQIFSISHQPQLASRADAHFLVYKNRDGSFVKKLNFQERVEEIARIIGGKKESKKAKEYALELLKGSV